MKRKFITFTAALVVAACAVFSGCSCTGQQTLSFNSAFHGGTAPTNTYTETLNYEVKYSEDYLANFKKAAALDEYCTFEYTDGSYRSEFRAATNDELSEKDSDVKNDERVNTQPIYKITTNFSVNLTLSTLNGETLDYTHPESIKTTAYIAWAGAAFAPIYTEEKSEYCMISVKDGKAEVYVIESTNQTLYNKDEYTKTLTYRKYKIDEPNIDGVEFANKTDTVKYDFLTAIDNAEFIFALRGLSLEEKAETTVSVVSAAYTDPKSLKITNTQIASENMTINYVKDGDEAAITETIKYNTLEYRINSTNAAGWAQSINIQAEKAGELPNYALPLKFAKPLFAYNSGSILNMGSLVFTLTSVEINN